jgi:hypothetical protein
MPNSLLPKDLWTDGVAVSTAVGKHLRTVFYGRPEVPVPIADYSRPMPNIGHVIWIGGGSMKFSFFLSISSLVHCAGVDEVYVHGDRPPSGPYWKLMLATQANRVKFVPRENMGQVRNLLSRRSYSSLMDTRSPHYYYDKTPMD